MKCPHAFICKQPYQDIGLAMQTQKVTVYGRGEASVFTCQNMLTDRHAWLWLQHSCTVLCRQAFYQFLTCDISL